MTNQTRYQPEGHISMDARLYGLHHALLGAPLQDLAEAMERDMVRAPGQVLTTVPGTDFTAAVVELVRGLGEGE